MCSAKTDMGGGGGEKKVWEGMQGELGAAWGEDQGELGAAWGEDQGELGAL